MRHNDMDLEHLLGGLPRSQSDAVRAERVRSRCHGMLARANSAPLKGRRLESALLGTFSLIYLCAVALFALQSHGVL